MLQKLHRIRRRPFVRNVAALASGTAAAQAISMAFSPVVTRLFGPEAYGLQGVFMSLAGLVAAIAAMTYPIAIVLPRSDADALGIARLSIYIGVATSLLVTVVLLFFGGSILTVLNAEEVSAFMYLIPVFMFITVLVRVLQQWSIRKKSFKLMARVSVWEAFAVNLTKLGMGIVNPVPVALIVINTAGGLFHAAMLWVGLRKKPSLNPKRLAQVERASSAWDLARRHSDFPVLRAPQTFLNAASLGLPVFLLASLFGSEAAGFYAIAKTVLSVPTLLVGSSVMQVFYPHFNEAVYSGRNARTVLIKAMLGMATLGLIPYLAVIILGPLLFQFVFGSEWRVAGEYAQWLAVWLFIVFLNRPIVAAIPVLRMQGVFLIYEIISILSRGAALYVGSALFQSADFSVAVFSIVGALLNALLIGYVLGFSQTAIGVLKRQERA